jgi:hypothetical protein
MQLKLKTRKKKTFTEILVSGSNKTLIEASYASTEAKLKKQDNACPRST